MIYMLYKIKMIKILIIYYIEVLTNIVISPYKDIEVCYFTSQNSESRCNQKINHYELIYLSDKLRNTCVSNLENKRDIIDNSKLIKLKNNFI